MDEITTVQTPETTEPVQTTESSQPVDSSSAGTETVTEETYQPNYKFKSLGEEREFDDWAKGAIKSAEHEKAARELYEKAYGLDHYKEKYSKKDEAYKSLASEHEKVQDFLNQITFLKENAPDKFCEVMQFDPIKLLQQKLNYEQMTPEQRAVYDENKQVKLAQYKHDQELATYKQVYTSQVATNLNMQMDMLLSQPKYAKAMELIPDFRAQIGEYGRLKYDPQRGDIPPQEAIEAVYNRYAKFLASNGEVAQPGTIQPTVDSKPVIPKVKGSTSAVSQKITTVDDIKKLYNKKFGVN